MCVFNFSNILTWQRSKQDRSFVKSGGFTFFLWCCSLMLCTLTGKPFQISLSGMCHLLGKLGLAGLPFKPTSRDPNTDKPITEKSRRSRHVSLLWLVVSLLFCPAQHIKLTKLRSNCKTKQCWAYEWRLCYCIAYFCLKCFQKHILVTV